MKMEDMNNKVKITLTYLEAERLHNVLWGCKEYFPKSTPEERAHLKLANKLKEFLDEYVNI